MEYINNDILCLEYEELVPVIFTEPNFKYHKAQGNITVHGLGGNGRKVLIEFETMPEKYRLAVRKHYGDPYQYASKQPILRSVIRDDNAFEYYNSYVLPNGDKLPNTDTDLRGKAQINYVERYTVNASWLNMLERLTTDKQALKRELNISIMKFWETATEMIKLKSVALPANPKRLKEKLNEYKAGGYEVLIEKHKWGNSNSAKVNDEVAEAFLKELIAHRNKHDDTIIAARYNEWAERNGREKISAGTVTYRRKQWGSELMFEREGLARTAAKLSKQIKRERASAPLLLINSDDNVFDAFFINGDDKWYRPVLYVVIDTYNDYILGYAWGDNVTKELVKEAYRNAMRHVIELTGDAYCWQQLQTDRWGISGKNTTELEQFYTSMGTFTPAALKNAQSKYIERAFGTTWHQTMKQLFLHNYSGHNVTSREKLNTDLLHTSSFPDISQAGKMIEAFVWAMRNTKRTGCELTRHEEWLQAFGESEKSKKKLLTPATRLQIFGKVHEPKNGKWNSIEAGGLQPTICGVKRVYELSQEQIFEHIGKQVQVIYDEHDPSHVLVTDGKTLRTVLWEYGKVPAAFADYGPGAADRIKMLQAEKKTLLPKMQQMAEDRKGLLQRVGIDAESRLQAGVLVKQIAHNDQRILTQNGHETRGVRAKNEELEEVEVPAKKPLKAFKQQENTFYDEW